MTRPLKFSTTPLFKEGDVVKCIEPVHSRHLIQKDDTYIVKSITREYSEILGNYHWFVHVGEMNYKLYQERFKPVSPTSIEDWI